MVATPFASHSTLVLPFCGGLCFLHEHCWLWSSSLSFSQIVPPQTRAGPSLGLLSKLHIPAPSPCVTDVQVCGTDHLCGSHFVLSATNQLLGLLESLRFLFCHPPAGEGTQLDAGTSPHLQLPARGAGSILLHLLFISLSPFFVLCGYIEISLVLLGI